jgi:hypothetical protein
MSLSCSGGCQILANALARAEINFDAHSENPLKRVELPMQTIARFNVLDLCCLGLNPSSGLLGYDLMADL